MVNTAIEFIKRLDSEGKKYTSEERKDQSDVVSLNFSAKNCNSMTIRFFFDGDGKSVAVRCFSLCTYTKEKVPEAIYESNKLNNEYRWVRFSIDKDNELAVSADAIITEQSAADVCYELLARMVNIIDDTYPRYMRIRWGL